MHHLDDAPLHHLDDAGFAIIARTWSFFDFTFGTLACNNCTHMMHPCIKFARFLRNEILRDAASRKTTSRELGSDRTSST